MGTSNFCPPENADCIYAIMTDTDDETVESMDIEIEIEDAIANISAVMEKYAKEKGYVYTETDKTYDYDRNFPATEFGELDIKTMDKEDTLLYFESTIKLFRRSGYYDGVQFDYGIEYGWEEYRTDSSTNIDDIREDIVKSYIDYMYGSELDDEKYQKIKEEIEEKFDEVIDETVGKTQVVEKKINEVYSQYTTPIKIIGRFSNGESIYETCRTDKKNEDKEEEKSKKKKKKSRRMKP